MLTRRRFLGTGALAAAGGLLGCSRSAGPDRRYDVCVIGSGFAGVYLALETTSRGLDTVVIEAGAASREEQAGLDLDDSFGFETSGEIRYPVNAARMIAVGGTSNHWTGMVNRLRPSDLRLRSEFDLDVDWPFDYEELAPYYCRAEQLLGTTGYDPVSGAEPPRDCAYPYRPEQPLRIPVVELNGSPLTFFPVPTSRLEGRRGPVRLASAEIPRLLERSEATLLSGRQAEQVVTLDGKRIDHVLVRTAQGGTEKVHAGTFVVAAGVLESARLLQRSRSRWFPEGPGNSGDLVGRHFTAHPTFLWGIPARDLRGLTEGVFRTYEFNDRMRAEGFNACHYQLEVGRSTLIVWKLQPELQPSPDNRVSLSAKRTDRFGVPLPDLRFRFSDRDRKTFDRARGFLERQVRTLGADPGKIERVERWRHHPAGTCRMGFDDTNGVVDADGRVFGVENLFVSGACVFPTAGTSNPTLTVVALTLRLADRLGAA